MVRAVIVEAQGGYVMAKQEGCARKRGLAKAKKSAKASGKRQRKIPQVFMRKAGVNQQKESSVTLLRGYKTIEDVIACIRLENPALADDLLAWHQSLATEQRGGA